MAKIIEHNFSGRGRNSGVSLFTRSFGYYAQMIEDKKRLMEEMAAEARIFIAREGMDPDSFVLSGDYVRDFFSVEMDMSDPEGSPYAELVYHRADPDRIISVCEFAQPDTEDQIKISFLILSLPGYREGGRVWQRYNFETGTWEKDEEEYFDPGRVLAERRRALEEE